jgi:hypothetical protein
MKSENGLDGSIDVKKITTKRAMKKTHKKQT